LRSTAGKVLLAVALTALSTPLVAHFFIVPDTGPLHTSYCVNYTLSQNGSALHFGYAEFPISEFEYQHGMKHRIDLHPDSAMIFYAAGSRDVSLWMQDTPSALDMAFFDERGVLVYLAQAKPFSEELISAPGNPSIGYVMELPAGRSQEIKLEVGVTRLTITEPAHCAELPPIIHRKDLK
jgi:uncharacterized membrane protein (UPF0127 family)|tara:strand:+ start:5214 stop:5753 length:540 start_codon:yes stop_codon:yes gene_type:complete